MKTQIKSLVVFLVFISLPAIGISQFLVPRDGSVSDTTVHHHVKHKWRDTIEFPYPVKQVFFQGQAVLGFPDLGFHAVVGYRLGQFGILGGGIGADQLFPLLTFFVSNNHNGDLLNPFNGGYFPVFAHYEGDILKKWATPYYAVEAGYSFRYTSNDNNSYITVTPATNTVDHSVYKYYGGFTGAFEFGVKFYCNHSVFVNLALTLDVQQARDKYTDYFYNSLGQEINLSYNSSAFIFVPGLKVACGFHKPTQTHKKSN
jgi:hypothetical protein